MEPHFEHQEQQHKPGLVRALGPWMATAVVVGTVIGSGIFKKPSSIAASVPNFTTVSLVWIAGGLLALLGALALAEVAVLFPRSGGNYVFLREGYGRLAGFLWGWVDFWIIRAASIAALATIFVESLHDLLIALFPKPASWSRDVGAAPVEAYRILSQFDERALIVGVIAMLTLINIRGVRWGGGLQLFITLVKVISLLAIIVLPLVFWNRSSNVIHLTVPASQRGTPSYSWGGLASALLAVHWAYHGWMNIVPVAEEVKNPSRNLPIALIGGVCLVIFLYLGANVAYDRVIPQNQMAQLTNTTVLAEFARRLPLGAIGGVLASAAVMCSVFGALNGNILVGPRLLYAMGEDRLAPRVMSDLHPSYHTPVLAIAATGGWAIVLVLACGAIKDHGLPIITLAEWTIDLNPAANASIFDLLTNFAMFGAVIFETMAVTTIFVFRRTLPDAERPYRCWGYPVTPLLYLVLPAFILWNMFSNQRTEVAVGSGFIILGVVVYLFIDRPPGRSPSAPR